MKSSSLLFNARVLKINVGERNWLSQFLHECKMEWWRAEHGGRGPYPERVRATRGEILVASSGRLRVQLYHVSSVWMELDGRVVQHLCSGAEQDALRILAVAGSPVLTDDMRNGASVYVRPATNIVHVVYKDEVGRVAITLPASHDNLAARLLATAELSGANSTAVYQAPVYPDPL